MIDRNFYITKLNSELDKRKLKNPSYSTRSYARDLEMDSSSLSSILKGNRKIPHHKIEQLADVVCGNETEKKQFIESATQVHTSLNKIKKQNYLTERVLVSDQDFAKIADIETYTFLSMLELEDFRYDTTWMARKLKSSRAWVEDTIQNLLDLGMIKEVENTLIRTTKRTTTSDEVASKYILKHHMDSLELAKRKCIELKPNERYFSTITIPSDPEHLNHLKTLFMEFEDKISEYLSTKKKTDVFKLSIQFYPATEKDL